MPCDIASSKTSQLLFTSTETFQGTSAKFGRVLRKQVTYIFGCVPVFRNRELRHAAGQLNWLEFPLHGRGFLLQTWETLRLTVQKM